MKYFIFFLSLAFTQVAFSQTDNQKTIDSLKREILILKVQNGLLKTDDFSQNGTSNSEYELNNLVDEILNSQLGYFELAINQINSSQMEDLIEVVQNNKVTQIMRDKLIKELTYFKNKVEGELKK